MATDGTERGSPHAPAAMEKSAGHLSSYSSKDAPATIKCSVMAARWFSIEDWKKTRKALTEIPSFNMSVDDFIIALKKLNPHISIEDLVECIFKEDILTPKKEIMQALYNGDMAARDNKPGRNNKFPGHANTPICIWLPKEFWNEFELERLR